MKTMSYLAVAAAFMSGSPLLAASSTSEAPAQASRLLREVRSLAYALDRDAATLESYRLNGTDWRAHAHQLALAKQHINSIGDRLERLQAMRGSTAPWQQEAIDSMLPIGVQLASRTEAAIRYVNENQGRLFVPTYTEHLGAIAGHAGEMKESVDAHLELAGARERMDKFRGAA